MAIISASELRAFSADLLSRAGFDETEAGEMADLLVWANLRGIDSHGVLRIPRYIEMLQLGLVKTGSNVKATHQFGAVCILDADKAPGATAMNRAVREASALAERYGLGWCGVRDTSHAGAIGYFVKQLADEGKIGIGMTASKPLMSYFGAKGEALSSNPLAIAVPQGANRPPIILDMSTAAVALGKIMAAKDSDRAIPTGWGVDADGEDTTDPHKIAAILPMAGAKGSGLSLMIEILCSVLAHNPSIAPALNGGQSGGFNGMILAVDPKAFGDPEAISADVVALADAIHALQPVAGTDRVRLPGERGHEAEVAKAKTGITVSEGTVKRLKASALEVGAAIPASFAG